MKNTSNLDLKAVSASDSADWIEAFSVRSREHIHERAALRTEGVDPQIFSHVYSHIFNHRGSDDSRALVELISAICLGRTAFYFEALESLQWPVRDLGLELIKAKLYGAFSPEVWEEARLLASNLNQPSSSESANANATGRGPIHKRPANPKGAPDSASRTGETPEKRLKGNSERAMRFGSSDFETRPGEQSLARAGRPFWRKARTALLYGSQRVGLDNFKHLWGGAAAAAVIGFCALLVALDEVERRSFTPLLSEQLALSSQVRDPVPLSLDTSAEDDFAPQEGPSPETAEVAVAEAVGLAPEEGSNEPVVSSEESPAPEGEVQVTEQAAPENETVPARPLVSATENAVPADSSPPQKASATAPSVESPAKEIRATTSEPLVPVQKKVTTGGRGSKTANPSLVKRSAPRKVIPPPNPQVVETTEPVSHQVQVETPGTPAVEQPPAVSEPSEQFGTQNPAPAKTTDGLVENSDSNPPRQQIIANVEPAPEVKAPQKRESLLEDWLGFNPREVIAKIQPGRRANEPHFIRQLEGVEGPAEN